jgi:hypothetical protein
MLQVYYVELSEDLEGHYIRFEATDILMVRRYLEVKYLIDETESGHFFWGLPWKTILDHDEFSRLRTHRVTINARCGPLERQEQDASNEG